MLIIHEVFVNLSRTFSANSLDCFVPRNDKKMTYDPVIANIFCEAI
jgi:hypothetical protein